MKPSWRTTGCVPLVLVPSRERRRHRRKIINKKRKIINIDKLDATIDNTRKTHLEKYMSQQTLNTKVKNQLQEDFGLASTLGNWDVTLR